MKRFLWVIVLCNLVPLVAFAQAPVCQNQNANSICYLQGDVRVNGGDARFTQVDSVLPLREVQTLQTIEEVLVEDTQQAQPVGTVELTTNSGTNFRDGPGPQYQIVGSVAGGQRLLATGRNEDASWVTVLRDDGSVAWVYAPILNKNGDLLSLPFTQVATQTAPTVPEISAALIQWQPEPILENQMTTMLVFGNTQVSIGQVDGIVSLDVSSNAQSGVLVQSSTLSLPHSLILQGQTLLVSPGTTVLFQVIQGVPSLNILEGTVTIERVFDTVDVVQGNQLQIESGDFRAYSDDFYATALTNAFPLGSLPRSVQVVPPQNNIAVFPNMGIWEVTYGTGTFSCDNLRMADASLTGLQIEHRLAASNGGFDVFVADSGQGLVRAELDGSSYLGWFWATEDFYVANSYQALSATKMVGIETTTTNGCETVIPFEMQFVRDG